MLTYDTDGNMTSDGEWTYTWNGENRMIQAVKTDDTKIEFKYDFMGRRFEKKKYSWVSSAWQLDSTKKFVYNGYKQIAEFDANDALQKSYTWQPVELDVPLWVKDSSTYYYYIVDGNKNVRSMLDVSGNEVAQYDYNPFGKITASSGTYKDTNKYRFSSEYHDDETGIVYYNYRPYLINIGRWLSRDPIGVLGGVNLYGFVNNDAVNNTDLLGLALYAFDGTGMDKDNPARGGRTNVAILYDIYQGKGHYVAGVGSGNWFDRAWGGYTGSGGAAKLSEMYSKLVEFWKAGDHDIDIIGFSRGAALARAFANMINEKGIEISPAQYVEYGDISYYTGRRRSRKVKDAVVVACPKIRFLGLFDTVGSFGIPGNDVNLGYNLKIPGFVDYTAQATALNETRTKFPLSSIYGPNEPINLKKKIEKGFRGVHSDIGGGYKDSPYAAYKPLYWMWQRGKSKDVPFGPLPGYVTKFLNSKAGKSNNVMIHNSLLLGHYYDDDILVDYFSKKSRVRQIYYY